MRIRTVVAVAMLVLATTACGATSRTPAPGTATPSATTTPSTSTGSADAAVRSATAKTLAQRSARVVVTYDGQSNGRSQAYTLSGVMRLDGLEADLSGVLLPGTIPGLEASVPVRMVTYHGTIYYHYVFPNGRAIWLKSDAAKKAAGGVAGSDADAQLRALDSAKGMTFVGSQTIGGVGTRHYSGTMESKSAAAQLAEMTKTTNGPTSLTLPLEVWIDSHGRLVREDVTMSYPATTGTFTSHSSMTFSEWGAAVKVTPPHGAVDVASLGTAGA